MRPRLTLNSSALSTSVPMRRTKQQQLLLRSPYQSVRFLFEFYRYNPRHLEAPLSPLIPQAPEGHYFHFITFQIIGFSIVNPRNRLWMLSCCRASPPVLHLLLGNEPNVWTFGSDQLDSKNRSLGLQISNDHRHIGSPRCSRSMPVVLQRKYDVVDSSQFNETHSENSGIY